MSNSTQSGLADHNLYGYEPSKSAAYAFVALFSLAGLTHFILMFPFRAAFFIPCILGCAMEAGGYYFRVMSSENTFKILPFVLQGLLILAAPPLIAATIYMIFGRIIRSLEGESYSLISPKWLTAIFVLGDLICLGSQLAGSILRADASSLQTGSAVVLGGLIFQVTIFCLFAMLTYNFHVRFRRSEVRLDLLWGRHLAALYMLSLLFIIRNLVRIIEFCQGDDGFLVTHESMLYLFDGGTMLLIVVIPLIVHPGKLFKSAMRFRNDGIGGMNEMTPLATVKS